MNELNIKESKIIYSKGLEKTYHVAKNTQLTIFQYINNASCNITINLEENAILEFHLSIINYDDHDIKVTINHQGNNSVSNIFNHGINIKNKALTFDINGVIPKKSNNCICNQENQIINLENGQSTIIPKLLIDNYNVSSAHSAYIGKFKEEHIFYLMSRGLSKKLAIELLMKSFLINNGDENSIEVKNYLKEIMEVQNG